MGQPEYFNINESLQSGVDFFGTSIPTASIGIVCSSEVAVSAIKITSTSSDNSASADVAASAIEIVYASANLACEGATVSFGFGISIAQSILSSNVDLTVSASKIAKTSPQITDILCNVETVAQKEVYASSAVSSSADTQTASTRVTTLQNTIVALSGASVSLNLLFRTANINILLNNNNVIATAIRFSPVGVDDTYYKTLFMLDGKPLTNHGRTTSTDYAQIFIQNTNWNGSTSRYYKRSGSSPRRSFSLNWSMVPNSRYDTVDQRYSRDYIRELAQDPDVHVLKVLNNNESGTTPYTETTYNVYIKDYSESLIRRDLSNDIYLWECSLTLEEV